MDEGSGQSSGNWPLLTLLWPLLTLLAIIDTFLANIDTARPESSTRAGSETKDRNTKTDEKQLN